MTTFYHHPLDILLTISLPTMLSLLLLPSVSSFEFVLLSVYKIFSEISGHAGKRLAPTGSFPQFIWLPKWLSIELYTEDHDLHHSMNNCNYAKRFSLWDKVFGTFRTF
jgi:sterol desaturase/sphingolipid hydroxylase (fatty acid hydroxylase superfamily)